MTVEGLKKIVFPREVTDRVTLKFVQGDEPEMFLMTAEDGKPVGVVMGTNSFERINAMLTLPRREVLYGVTFREVLASKWYTWWSHATALTNEQTFSEAPIHPVHKILIRLGGYKGSEI